MNDFLDATGRDADYLLSLDHVAAMYGAAGRPRTFRTLQRYRANGHLEAQKLARTTGDKYLVAPLSVERHIAQLRELVRQGAVATGRDKSQQPSSKQTSHPIPAQPNISGASLRDFLLRRLHHRGDAVVVMRDHMPGLSLTPRRFCRSTWLKALAPSEH